MTPSTGGPTTTASPSGLTGTLGTVVALATLQMRPQSHGATASAVSSSGEPPNLSWPSIIRRVSDIVRKSAQAAQIARHAWTRLRDPALACLCRRLLSASRCVVLQYFLTAHTDGCRCARHTEEECIQGGLFGLPDSLAETERGAVEALAPGLPLFLFNFQTRVSATSALPKSCA